VQKDVDLGFEEPIPHFHLSRRDLFGNTLDGNSQNCTNSKTMTVKHNSTINFLVQNKVVSTFFCPCTSSFGMRPDGKRGVGFSGRRAGGRRGGRVARGGQSGARGGLLNFPAFSADTWRLMRYRLPSPTAVAPVLVAATGLLLRPASCVLRLLLLRRLLLTDSLALTEIPMEFGIIYISPSAWAKRAKCIGHGVQECVCVPDFPFIFRVLRLLPNIRTFFPGPISGPLGEKSKTARVSYRLLHPLI